MEFKKENKGAKGKREKYKLINKLLTTQNELMVAGEEWVGVGLNR